MTHPVALKQPVVVVHIGRNNEVKKVLSEFGALIDEEKSDAHHYMLAEKLGHEKCALLNKALTGLGSVHEYKGAAPFSH